MTKFYVYEHWRPDLDLPFYVGKGSGVRFDPNRTRNRHHSNIKSKLKKLGMCVEVRMVASGLSENDALRLEVERIAFWRERGIELSNKTAGGDGLKSPPEDVLEKMRIASKKRWALSGSREKHSAATKSGMDDDAVRAKLSKAQSGKKASDETRAKMSASQLGHVVSKEAREKISKAHLGNTYGSKTRGKPRPKMSDDTKAKMRDAQQARREREKGLTV
ncbi:intron associated endonuclease [Caudoviricetes sp.]|nr:intron associated endonuclease [Caudoviricetes sp.]